MGALELLLVGGGCAFVVQIIITLRSKSHVYTAASPISIHDQVLNLQLPRKRWWCISYVLFVIAWQIVASSYCMLVFGWQYWALFTLVDYCLWKLLYRRQSSSGVIPGAREESRPPVHCSETFSIMCFNFFMRSPGCPGGTVFGEEYKDQRINDFLQLLGDQQSDGACFDAICFQEVFAFGHFRQERLMAGLRDLGYVYFARSDCFAPLWNSIRWIDSGLLTVSRFPIDLNRSETFQDLMGGCQFTEKGILYTGIPHVDHKGHRTQIHLFNTHCQSSRTEPRPDQKDIVPPLPEWSYRVKNIKQAKELLLSILPDAAEPVRGHQGVSRSGSSEGTSRSDGPKEKKGDIVILTGDLNMDSRRPSDPQTDEEKLLMEGFALFGDRQPLDPHRTGKPKNEHLGTYGPVFIDDDGVKRPFDTVLCEKGEQGCDAAVDYILVNQRHVDVSVTGGVEKFLIKRKEYQMCSDHFGISAKVTIRSEDKKH